MATPKHVLEFFSFEDYIDKHLRKHCDSEGFVTVFDITNTPSEFRKITCALLPLKIANNELTDFKSGANIDHFCGMPFINGEYVLKKELNKTLIEPDLIAIVFNKFVREDNCFLPLIESDDYETKYIYRRFGNDENIKPLVIERISNGSLFDSYVEISEEFRHLFDSHLRENGTKLIRYDSDGNEIPIAKIANLQVRIRLRELKEYLTITNQILKIKNFSRRNNKLTLDDNELSKSDIRRDIENTIYTLHTFNCKPLINEEPIAYSRLDAFKIIYPLDNFSFEDFSPIINTDNDHESFIYGYDEDGTELEFSCKENLLNDTFNPKKNTPKFLTQIYFTKDVLSKYYNNPEDYDVTEYNVTYKSLWSLKLCEINEDCAIVYLGDLGRIPYNEQKYWRRFNIPPQNKMSETAYKRTKQGEFTEPSQPDEYFKYFFPIFNKKWFDYFDWYLFKELNKSDQYHWKTLRIPLEENSKEFEEQFISLSKILVDSINDEIKSKTNEVKDTDRSIAILEKFCIQNTLHSSTPLIKILRVIQKTRSTASAHRKGRDFHKFAKKQGFSDGNYVGFLRDIFNQLNEIMKDLIAELEDRAQPKEE